MNLHSDFRIRRQPSNPHPDLLNRASLEHILDFTLVPPVATPDAIRDACLLYHTILHDCQIAEIPLDPNDNDNLDDQIPQLHSLFRCLYKYCPTPEGQINILQTVLHALFPPDSDYLNPSQPALSSVLPRGQRWLRFSTDEKREVYTTLQAVAADFLRGFFAPLRAQGGHTPVVSPLIVPQSQSEVGSEQGTPGRLRNLRQLCLLRDSYRCVITGEMDSAYLETQIQLARRKRMLPPDEIGLSTEVAHIIPHAFNALRSDGTFVNNPSCFPARKLTMYPTVRVKDFYLACHEFV